MPGSVLIQLKSNSLHWIKLLRRTLRRSIQSAHYGKAALANTPILFANSFPKSGTHLLTQILEGFTSIGPAVISGLPAIVTFAGESGRHRSQEEISSDLKRLLPGDIAYGHLHAFPNTVAFFCSKGTAAYFMMRDPRDVVLSHAHYITDMAPDHIHHYFYKNELNNLEERVSASIMGFEYEGSHLPNIQSRIEPYMEWLNHSEVLAVRFEDFIGKPDVLIGQVLDHAVMRGFIPHCDRDIAIKRIKQKIDPSRSPTFRSGKIGGWRSTFSTEQKRLFKEITGDMLLQLGYEVNHDW